MKPFVFSICLLGLQAAAKISVEGQQDFATSRYGGQLLRRAEAPGPKGRPKCGLDLFTSRRYTVLPEKKSKREETLDGFRPEESDRVTPRNESSLAAFLAKRQMLLPEGPTDAQMTDFMVQEGAKKQNRGLVWSIIAGGIKRGVNNARFSKAPSQRNPKAFGFSLDYLAGCTALMIVSRSGIYGGHYWENIGFNLDDIHRDLYKDQEDAFQKSIVDALHNGYKGHQSLAEQAKLIGDDASIKAFLMVPDEGPAKPGEVAKKDPYTEAWGKMQDEIGKIIPKLQDKNRWEIVKYHPAQDDERKIEIDDQGNERCTFDPLDHTYRGRMLCKFDPDHDGKRKITLWIENKQYHDDTCYYESPQK